MTLADRFWPKVDRRSDDECWPWMARRDPRGYGRIWNPSGSTLAHRVAFELLVGPIDDDKELDHLCRNHECVNPYHLEPVTHAENVHRGVGGWNMRAKTHCPQGHPYDEANTCWSKGERHCRACNRERERARRTR